MGKSPEDDQMGNHSKGSKEKSAKRYSRAQAIKAMKNGGCPPEQFLDMENPYRFPDVKNPHLRSSHPNYHARNLAWKLMGRPMPFEGAEKTKFLKSIHVKDDSAVVEATEETNEEVSE
jgi:hypothetical protein